MFKTNKYNLAIYLSIIGLIVLLFATITPNVWSQDEKEIKILIGKLKDPNVSVRINAAIALGDIGPDAKAAVPALIEALNDKEGVVRWRAVAALGKMRSYSLNLQAIVPIMILLNQFLSKTSDSMLQRFFAQQVKT